MAAKWKSHTEDYALANGEVTLRVVVGDGQLGSSLVSVDKTQIASGAIAFLTVGTGPSLVGKSLRVVTTVTDVQRMTNRTSVLYLLRGGKADRDLPLEETVDEEGDSVHYVVTFKLVA